MSPGLSLGTQFDLQGRWSPLIPDRWDVPALAGVKTAFTALDRAAETPLRLWAHYFTAQLVEFDSVRNRGRVETRPSYSENTIGHMLTENILKGVKEREW